MWEEHFLWNIREIQDRPEGHGDCGEIEEKEKQKRRGSAETRERTQRSAKESEYDKQGAAAFSEDGLQDARFVTAASSQGLTVSKNPTAFAVIKWNTI